MTLVRSAGSDRYLEPATNSYGDVDTPTPLRLQLSSGDYTLVSIGIADGGSEDDGTGDFTIYAVASLPGTRTQLAFTQTGTNDVDAHEVPH